MGYKFFNPANHSGMYEKKKKKMMHMVTLTKNKKMMRGVQGTGPLVGLQRCSAPLRKKILYFVS